MRVRYYVAAAFLALLLAACGESITGPVHNAPAEPAADGGWAGGGG